MLGRMSRIALGILLLLLVGCANGGETTETPSPTPQATTEPTDIGPASPPAECVDETITGNVEVTVRQTDNAFSPSCLIVLGGQGLEIQNRGESLHNFSIEGTVIDLDTRPGETNRYEALAGALPPGSHEFFCKYHRGLGMVGRITLTEAG
jgi:plastocyanin